MLSARPLLNARARRFVVAVSVRRLHTGDESVGIEPSVVQRIVAPPVAVVMVTETAVVNQPEPGVKVGAGSCC